MDALSAYPAGEVQAVFTFLGGNVLIEHIPCALADAALEQPVRFQIGKIAVHGAETDVLLRQRVCDLPCGHLLVCVPGQIVQQLPALPCQILCHQSHLQFATYSQIIIHQLCTFVNMRISRKSVGDYLA
jgi:hypothetical protein